MTVPLISSILAGLQRRRMAVCKPFTSLLLAMIVAFAGYAQTIGNWTFTNTLTGTGSSYTTVGTISLGSGIPTNAFNGGTEWFGENGWPAGGLNTNAYIQFTITPNAGYELNLTDIVLRLRRSNTGSPAGSGPTQWSLRSSLDGFASDITSNNLTHNYANYTVALNSTYHHLYSTVTFRLYGYSVTLGSGGTSRLVVDNIAINGLSTVLPVTFSAAYTQRTANNNIFVHWQVNNIQAGTRFNLQRSPDGTNYTTIYTVTESTDLFQKQYSYTDACRSGLLFYRIEATELSGHKFFSPVMRLSDMAITHSLISFVSVSGQLLVTGIQVIENGNYTLLMHDANGVLVQKKLVPMQAGFNAVTLGLTGLPHGVYTVSLYNGKRISTKKMVY